MFKVGDKIILKHNELESFFMPEMMNKTILEVVEVLPKWNIDRDGNHEGNCIKFKTPKLKEFGYRLESNFVKVS